MTAANEPTTESLLEDAKALGLPLTEEEATRLLTGVKRNLQMAESVRSLLALVIEPAPVFNAGSNDKGG